jgi:hypothetical protein
MAVGDIETADCCILKKYSNKIQIYFDAIYSITKKQYINNICLSITD